MKIKMISSVPEKGKKTQPALLEIKLLHFLVSNLGIHFNIWMCRFPLQGLTRDID